MSINTCLTAQELIPFQNDSKWGYLNKEKEIIIDAKYDSVSIFQFNLAVVKTNKKYGLINKEDNWILKSKFDKIRIIDANQIETVKRSKKRFYNNSGKRIKTKYHVMKCGNFNNSRELATYSRFPFLKKNDKYSLLFKKANSNKIDSSEFIYTSLSTFGSKCYIVQKDSKKAIFNPYQHETEKQLEFIIDSLKYNRINYYDDTLSTLLIYVENSQFGLLNFEGKIILNPEFDIIQYSENKNLYLVMKSNNEYFYFDNEGNSYELKENQ